MQPIIYYPIKSQVNNFKRVTYFKNYFCYCYDKN